ncbi:gluconate 2-dehydrogenase subunit 3 family protein [Ramlibacter albus]|uniref:Gluconate 2-dehydrogenase subunit 3 family protein n=1 Tax=Ramlibacter albus TaxID=2079448 RepID=A0A923MC10_9BURK|nr:gluconate 2-dehydrogenase subunit 3 family protein [Ramlibacter albus]MBC5766751.1 gluconate 2-dehydrogenase subunit 3 family protein [Ramlibacter albus]
MQRIALAAGAAFWMGESLAVRMAHAAAERPDAGPGAPLGDGLMGTLSALCETVIPKTDTPGAIEAGVPAFVAEMYRLWMTDAERTAFGDGLRALDADAQRRFGARFAQATAAQQAEVFGALREGVKGYSPRGFGLDARIADPAAPFFHKARDLITVGYFTSKVGIEAELAYVAVPGRFQGDVDVKTWNRQMQL